MKLDLFAKKDLENFLIGEFEDVLVIEWNKVANVIMKWIGNREKKESEEEVDEWFYNLSPGQKDEVAENIWENTSYEDKKEIANLE